MIVYGITKKGLADQLNVSEEEAQKYIDAYLKGYIGVNKMFKDTEKSLRKQRYVVTKSLGRKRRFPDFNKLERWKQESAIRSANNFKIQAEAANLFKKALVDLKDYLKEKDIYLVNLIHDKQNCRV